MPRMRKFLKPGVKKIQKAPQKTVAFWSTLRSRALDRAELNGIPEHDPRITLLKGYNDPEKALKRLSILSEVDITREFGPVPD